MNGMELVDIKHHFSSGVYAKEVRAEAGFVLSQHVHKYDHLSVLVSGVVDLCVEGKATRLEGYQCLTIPALKEHKIISITPIVWLCIHATNETDHEKIDAEVIA